MSFAETILDLYRILLGGFMSQIIVAVVVLFIGFIFGKIAGRAVKEILSQVDFDTHIKKAGFKQGFVNTISTSVSYLIYFIAILFALRQFNIVGPVFYFTILAVLVLLVFAATLSVRDFFPNFYSMLSIRVKHLVHEGDFIKIQNLEGTVESIGFVKTRLKSVKGETLFLPNTAFSREKFIKLNKQQIKNKV